MTLYLEYCNTASGYENGGEILDFPSDSCVLKKDSSLWT
jgi:hypothetical protein